jgi:hypothetical protein
MIFEESEIRDGKDLIHLVFGANRWEFEKLDEEGEHLPDSAEECLDRVRSTVTYLLKNWKRIAAEDRAMGEAGLTRDIAAVKSCGYSLVGIMSYRQTPDGGDKRKYNAFLRIVKDP